MMMTLHWRESFETGVTLRFVPSVEFAKYNPYSSKQFNMSPVLMNGDKIVGDFVGAYPQADGSWLIELAAPLLPEDVKTHTVKTVFLYASTMIGEPMAIGKSFTLGDSWEDVMVPQEIEGGTFDVNLTE